MLQVKLDDILRLRLSFPDVRWRENQTPHGRLAPPPRSIFRTRRPPRTKLVEERSPTGVFGERRSVGVQRHGPRNAEASGLKLSIVVLERNFYYPTNIFAIDTDTSLGVLQQSLKSVLFFLQAYNALVILVTKLAFGKRNAGRRFSFDCLGEAGRFSAANAIAYQSLFHRCTEDLTRCSQFTPYGFSLTDKRIKYAVLLALLVEEVATSHDFGWLQLAIDTSISLLKT